VELFNSRVSSTVHKNANCFNSRYWILVIGREDRNTSLTTYGGDPLYDTATGFLVAHVLEGDSRHVHQAEKVDLHLLADLLVLELFEAPGETVSCVIDYDIHATELLDGLVESIGNGVLVCDIETNAQEVLLGRVLELQLLRLAGGGDSDVSLVKHSWT
jgi:hypothetical protein